MNITGEQRYRSPGNYNTTATSCKNIEKGLEKKVHFDILFLLG